MSLVKLPELLSYMGGLKLTEEQQGIIESVILPGIQQELEDHLGRPVEPVRVREALRADEGGWVWFRVTPVHQIVAVIRSDGQTTTPVQTAWADIAPDDDYRQWTAWGNPDEYRYHVGGGASWMASWPNPYNSSYYLAEYIGGYNGYVNEGLKLDIMRVTAREVEMQFDDSLSLRGGNTEAASDSDTREKGWTEKELKKWDRLRRRTSA